MTTQVEQMTTQVDNLIPPENHRMSLDTNTTEPVQAPEKAPVDSSPVSPLECHICCEESDEPVSTQCGHIYCWACIYKWLQSKGGVTDCPVCKNKIAEDKLIPLYPKNYLQEKKNDLVTNGLPKRPHAKREGKAGHGLFTGINIRMPNLAVTIGCLPALIPIVLMIMLNFYACIFGGSYDNEEGVYVDDSSDSDYMEGGAYYRRPTTSYEVNNDMETDGFDWTVIALMILFVCLPFLLATVRRNRQQH